MHGREMFLQQFGDFRAPQIVQFDVHESIFLADHAFHAELAHDF
jgi:hypothetical protein